MQSRTLRLNQRIAADNVQIEFSKVVADSRCPKGRDCYWPGIFVAEIAVINGARRKTILIGNSDGRSVLMGETFEAEKVEYPSGLTEIEGLKIGIDSVKPERMSEDGIKENDYLISLSIFTRN